MSGIPLPLSLSYTVKLIVGVGHFIYFVEQLPKPTEGQEDSLVALEIYHTHHSLGENLNLFLIWFPNTYFVRRLVLAAT